MRTLWIVTASALGLAGCGDDTGPGGAAQGGAAQGGAAQGGAAQGGAAQGGAGGWDARFDPLVAALQEDLAATSAYGVSVAVMEGGQVTFAQAFGAKGPAGAEPLTPHTLMQIGSTTKQMTATAVLRRVEAGDVALSDSLETLLPDLEFAGDPSWDDQLTLHLLLSHQGGMADTARWTNTPSDALLADFSYGAFANGEYLMAPAGSFWNYSNPHFVMAGLVAEAFDTRPYPDLMRQDIFLPLGMDRTFLRKAEVSDDGDFSLSFGYTANDLATGAPQHDVSMAFVGDDAWTRPAGLAWSTPTQQLAWAKFVLHGEPGVLSDALRAEITQPHADTLYQVGTLHYGYGMFVEDGRVTRDGKFYPTPVWDHGGNTLTFSNELVMLPEHDFAIAITSSAFATDFSHSVDVAIESLVGDLPAAQPAPAYTVDPATFGRHLGTYDDPFNVGAMTVTQVGDALVVSLPDLDAMNVPYTPELTSVSSEIFLLEAAGQTLDLTFIPLSDGGDSEFVRNRAFVERRVTMTPAAPLRSALLSRDALVARLRAAALPPPLAQRLARGRGARR